MEADGEISLEHQLLSPDVYSYIYLVQEESVALVKTQLPLVHRACPISHLMNRWVYFRVLARKK